MAAVTSALCHKRKHDLSGQHRQSLGGLLFVTNISIDRPSNLRKSCAHQFPGWERSNGRLIL
jgi:hypothetical protein